MHKAFFITAAIVVLSYLVYLVLTLNAAPLPWFDEVFFASISKSLIDKGTFIATVSETARDGKESLAYGPVYFLLTGGVFKLFGFGIWQGRIINLLAGLGCIAFTGFYFRKKHGSVTAAVCIVLAFLLDPIVNQTLASGRMDWLAIFLGLVSIYFLQGNTRKSLWLSSLFAAAALLTTPRSAVMLIPLIPFAAFNMTRNKTYTFKTIIWCVTVIGIYSIWIAFAFGSIPGFFLFYNDMAEAYVGGNLYIPKGQYPLILVFLLSLLYATLSDRKKLFERDVLFCLLAIACFYLIVRDWGLYSVYIIPFYYYAVFSFIPQKPVKFRLAAPAVLIAVNLAYAAIKAMQVLPELQRRDMADIRDFVKRNIPAGSRVIGDGLYYYPAISEGNRYELFDAYSTLEERERKHRKEFNYDYIIVSRQSLIRYPYIPDHYFAGSHLIPVDSLITEQAVLSRYISGTKLVSAMEDHSYDAVIYKRIR